jgi:hypothetical protein
VALISYAHEQQRKHPALHEDSVTDRSTFPVLILRHCPVYVKRLHGSMSMLDMTTVALRSVHRTANSGPIRPFRQMTFRRPVDRIEPIGAVTFPCCRDASLGAPAIVATMRISAGPETTLDLHAPTFCAVPVLPAPCPSRCRSAAARSLRYAAGSSPFIVWKEDLVPYAKRNGLNLYFEQAGRGDPPLVFVHGWCCDRTFFQPQFDHFQASHAVARLDLRGCGRSDRPADGYDIPALADDVAWLCREVGIPRPVVVGHSLGGMIAIELAARHPSLPTAVVAVDPGAISPTPQARSVYEGLATQLEGPDGEAVRRTWIEG